MMILNLSESLAKPLVMAKLNMAYLSSLKNRAKLLLSSLPVSPSRVLRAHGIFVKFKKPSKTMMILNLSESLAKPLVMAKLNMAYLSSLKNRAKLLLSSLPVSPSRVLRAPGTSPYHGMPVAYLSSLIN